jgi:hypothetical protein
LRGFGCAEDWPIGSQASFQTPTKTSLDGLQHLLFNDSKFTMQTIIPESPDLATGTAKKYTSPSKCQATKLGDETVQFTKYALIHPLILSIFSR